MFRQAAAALLMAASAEAATIPISADRAGDQTATSNILTVTSDTEGAGAHGSTAGIADAGLAQSIAGPDGAVPDLNVVLLLTLAFLAAKVASIPGRH